MKRARTWPRWVAAALLLGTAAGLYSLQSSVVVYGGSHVPRRGLSQPVAQSSLRAANPALSAWAGDCSWHRHHPLFQEVSNFDGELEERAARGEPIRFTCPVCGHEHVTVEKWGNLREEGFCPACGASNRGRQLGLATALFATQLLDARVSSVADLGAHQPRLRVWNTQCSGPLHKLLRNASASYVCSEYLGAGVAPGARRRGVRHEDLARPSFPDASFDLVLSAEIFEHLPDPYAAFAQVLRVLAPGGAHVFTVPFAPAAADDVRKADVAPDGSVVPRGAPELHGDPLHPKAGIPVFTIFGQELVDWLCELGHAVKVLHLRVPSYGILGGNSHVFVAVKPYG